VLVRVIVVASAVMNLATWMAALDLDRRVTDGEPIAKSLLKIADDMLRIA
jgi:hypothetical protein